MGAQLEMLMPFFDTADPWTRAVFVDGMVQSSFGETATQIAPPSLRVLEQLSAQDSPGGFGFSEAVEVSRDGTIVVGNSTVGNANTYTPGEWLNYRRAFKWTAKGGMVNLGLPAGWAAGAGSKLFAQLISDDNSTIVGFGYGNADGKAHCWYWTQAGGMVDIGTVPATSYDGYCPLNVADDGSAIIGLMYDNVNRTHLFYWSNTAGISEITGFVSLASPAFQGGSGTNSLYCASGTTKTTMAIAIEDPNTGKVSVWTPPSTLTTLATSQLAAPVIMTKDQGGFFGLQPTGSGDLYEISPVQTVIGGAINGPLAAAALFGGPIVGSLGPLVGGDPSRVFYWDGTVHDIGDLGGGYTMLVGQDALGSAFVDDTSRATNNTNKTYRCVSTDATVVVGGSKDAAGNFRAFRYTKSLGIQQLIPGIGTASMAFAVNRDGSVACGRFSTGQNDANGTAIHRAFAWDQTLGFHDLGVLLHE